MRSAITAESAATADSSEEVDGHSIHRVSALAATDGPTETVDLGLGYGLELSCPGTETDIDLTSAAGNPDSLVTARLSTFSTASKPSETVILVPLRAGDDMPLWDGESNTDGNLEIVIWREDGVGVTAELGHIDPHDDRPFGIDGCAVGGKSIVG